MKNTGEIQKLLPRPEGLWIMDYGYHGKFSFLFGVVIGEKLFSITDTLSKALQKTMCSAMEAKRLAAVTLTSLKEQRSDSHFDKIWEELLVKG